MQPPCGKNDAMTYQGKKEFGHYQACTDQLIMAKDVKYYSSPPPGTSIADWANCSEVIPPETLVLPAKYMTGNKFTQKMIDRNFARTEWQMYQWPDYYKLNKNQGKKCQLAMKKYWCLQAMGLADTTNQKKFNKYALIPCRSFCHYLFASCNAYDINSTYGQDYFSGCFTPSSNPQAEWFDNPNGSPRGCFTENLTVNLPNCTSELGYECLNGGTWHAECLGCICPPGFGGYNCGRCSTSGRSFPGSYTKSLTSSQSPTALANGACKAMGYNSQCSEYTEIGNFIMGNNTKTIPMYECGVSLQNKFPLSAVAGGYISIKAKTSECKANGVPVDGDDTGGDSCFHCLYAGCDCIPNSIANEVQPPGVVRCAFFHKPINYKNPPVNAYTGCNSKTGLCYINAKGVLPVNPLILENCETSTCNELVRSTIAGLGPIWISFYVSSFAVAVLTVYATMKSRVIKTKEKSMEAAYDNSTSASNTDAINSRLLGGRVVSVDSKGVEDATFLSISYSTSTNSDDSSILQKITGKASMVDNGIYAIMGPSGAGKTTLLDVLAGRKENGKVGGVLLVDGLTYPTMSSRRRAFGYVLQDDSSLPSFLTVKEAIQFSADLRLPSNLTQSARDAKVDKVISQLGLSKVRNSYIGEIGSTGISGGERRRVSIGMELVVEPKVLLLDEPTSGLDAAAALKVVTVLTNLVTRGECLVIATIHQPRPDIYATFGRVLLLSGGVVAYEGPPLEIVDFLNSMGHTCPTNVNIADFALDNVRLLDKEILREKRLDVTERIFLSTDHNNQNRSSSNGPRETNIPKISICSEIKILSLHYSRELFRSRTLILLQYVAPLLVGIAFGFIYANIPNDISGVQNRAGAFFAMQVFWCLVSMSALDTWNAHQVSVRRFVVSGYYRISTYFISSVFGEILLLRFLPPIIFAAPFYYLAHRNQVEVLTFEKFAVFASILVFVSLSFTAICLTIGAIVRSIRAANAIAVLVMVLSLLFGGLLVNRNDAPSYYAYMFDALPLGYAFEAIMATELANLNINFDPKGVPMGVSTDGSLWLANLGLKNQIPYDFEILSIYVISCLLLSLLALNLRYQGRSSYEVLPNRQKSSSNRPSTVELRDVQTNDNTENEEPNTNYLPLTSQITNFFFSKIQYSASESDHSLLHKITGKASMVDNGIYAIMGPSGAGKTTLLDVLAGRKENGKVGGVLLVDGLTYPTMSSRRRAFGYVLQDDSSLPSFLTVKEAIQFSADLRLPSNLTQSARDAKVDKVISQLGLSKVRNSYIGEIGSTGISGGERRRVSIGMELVVEPKVLLLDEPTSGLDAAAALKVVTVLTNLVTRGECLVIATIHQPRPDIYATFGRVLLLSGGVVAYEGPPLEIVDFLNSMGHTCPINVNIADFALDIVPSLIRTEGAFNNAETEIATGLSGNSMLQKNMENKSCFRSFYYLIGFERKRICRSPHLILAHLLLSIVMGCVVGIVYYNMRNDLKGTLNRLFSLFTIMTFCTLMGMSAVSLIQGNEKVRFLRERASGYYSTMSFLATKVILDDFFMRLIPSIIFSLIAYNLINYSKVWEEDDFYNITSSKILPGSVCSTSSMPFQRAGSCLNVFDNSVAKSGMTEVELKASMAFYRSLPIFGVLLFLASTISSNICVTVGVLTNTNRVGTFVSVLLILLFTMFSGALINNNLLHDASWLFGWLRYVSPFEYVLEGLLIGQMQGQCFLFDPRTAVSSIGTDDTAVVCAEIAGETWLLNLGCSPVVIISMADSWKQTVAAYEEGEVFTKDAPGKWAGKEGGHTPVCTKNGDGTYTVVVNHGMTAADDENDDHWIEYVYAKDAENNVVGIQKFVPTDEAPTITFKFEGAGAVTPYAYCNKHGMWRGDSV
eukprot:g3347.t1